MRHGTSILKPAHHLTNRIRRIVSVIGILAAMNVIGLEQESLTEVLDQTRDEMNMPGLRAAVLFEDGRLVRSSVGLADKENEIQLNDTVGMPGGSTGKTFVSALTMLLVEDEVLSLDDPVSKWVSHHKWFKRLPNTETMEVRHLLSHSAGIADYPGTWRYTAGSIWRAIRRGGIQFSTEELIRMAHRRQPLFPAGEGYAYTDVGYLVLGHVIESASSRTYYELLRERILDPFELHEVREANVSALPDITPGYTLGARNLREDGTMKIDPTSEWTGGGLVTNPTMLVRFLSLLANGEIVRSDSFETMVDSGWVNPNTPDQHYGFGLFVNDNGRIVEHGGLWPGYRTHMRHYRDAGLTIAVQTNRDGAISMEQVVERVVSLVNKDSQ